MTGCESSLNERRLSYTLSRIESLLMRLKRGHPILRIKTSVDADVVSWGLSFRGLSFVMDRITSC